MTFRGVAASLIVAIGLTGTPAFTSGAAAQQAGAAQLNDHILPVAAGALIGAAAGFFLLPWLIPATAVAASAGASTTASPVLAAIGAGVGSIAGYEFGP